MKTKVKIATSRAVILITDGGQQCIGTVWVGLKKDYIRFDATTSLSPDEMILLADAMNEYLAKVNEQIPKH